jgi:hypothetical protein
MRGYKINTCIRFTPTTLIQIAAPGKPVSQITYQPLISTPEFSNRITISAIPLCPQNGKISHLITTRTNIPGFGNKFYLRDHGVLMNDIKKSSQPFDIEKLTSQCRSKIKTKTINMHFQYPVAKTVH